MNCPELPPQALETVDRLERFWSFPRKRLAQELRGYLDSLQRDTQALHLDHERLRDLAARQAQALEQLREQGQAQQTLLAAHVQQLDEERDRYSQLQVRQTEAAQRIGQLETLVSRQRDELESKRRSLTLMQEASEQWETRQSGLQQNLEQIQAQHMTLRQKFELVQRILALKAPRNQGLEVFSQLIREQYLSFAARESSLADEAGALLELQAIYQELELIVDFPSVRGKTLLAIAGGFSSGKSRFINSFIHGGNVKLAVGMNPVTVVPSYVVSAPVPSIRGYGSNGGSFELGEPLYASLSHEYLENFGFDLRSIMPFISVQVPLAEELFEHICLIDTPGYNAGGGQAMAADRDVAQALTEKASAMIWVIGLDPNGTITKSDLDFIESTNLYGESLYILLNKADTKSVDAIEKIIDEVDIQLRGYGFDYSGICAYSSLKREEHVCRGQSLKDFLRTHNHRHDVLGAIEDKIDAVFDLYRQAIGADIRRREQQNKRLEHFKLRALETGGTELFKAIGELCTPMESDFDVSGLMQLGRECEQLRKQFKAAARASLNEVLNGLRPTPEVSAGQV
ncbi:dynamin family protein [Pseudomonas sp. NY15436]|uniref:dynamin family protein n=1 Tax=Pseudomonas sp. NY15436 TaxID=3400359 RepID=UPI003A88D9C4